MAEQVDQDYAVTGGRSFPLRRCLARRFGQHSRLGPSLLTRPELARAAFRLAIERGPANVQVGDIAAEAGVSPHTFNNYFSSKEAAIIWLVAYRVSRTSTALGGRARCGRPSRAGSSAGGR